MTTSRELIARDDGEWFVIEGDPREGYVTRYVLDTADIGTFRRKWQAVEAAKEFQR